MSFCITDEDIKDVGTIGEKLIDLAGIVFRKHFYASYEEREDLISVGVVKALSLIAGGNFNQDKGKVLNFLYTGMRNEMHNYLYHRNKKIKGNDALSEATNDIYFEDEGFSIDFCHVAEVCSEFLVYGDLKYDVSDEMRRRGFAIIGTQEDEVSCGNYIMTVEFRKDLLDRICGAVLWKSREFFH